MSIRIITPKKSVNSAFLKLPVPIEKMESFKLSLKNLYSKRNAAQDEEYHKGEIWNFLRKIFEPDYSVQVNRPIDLCVFNGNTASAKPAVIIEAKSPTNATEMFSIEHPREFFRVIKYGYSVIIRVSPCWKYFREGSKCLTREDP